MAITDNTAKWQVKKITNFTDKEREIATQAQAEEGVDNTKIMTPKGVDYRLNKDRQLAMYRSVESIGLTLNSSLTMESIFNALPANSVLYIGGGSIITHLFPNNDYYGVLEMVKFNGDRTSVKFISNSQKSYYGEFAGGIFTGWKTLATTDNIPTIATQAQAEAGTNNTTVMTPLTVNSKIRQWIRGDVVDISPKTIESLRNKILEYAKSDTKNTFLVSMDAVWIAEWNAERTTQPFGNGQTWSITITDRVSSSYFSFEIGTYFMDESGRLAKVKWRGSYFGGTWSKLLRYALNDKLSMPSTGNVVSVSITASGHKYTAPADGWFCARFDPSSSSTLNYLYLDYEDFSTIGYSLTSTAGANIKAMLPVAKGQNVFVYYNDGTGNVKASFIYAQSEV